MRIKKSKKKAPFKLKSCLVALSLWGLSAVLALPSSPVMAAETASNATQEQVARALFNKGVALDNLHRYEEALAAYNDFITRFENSQEMYIRDYVATALLSKSIDLEILHRHKEAIAAHDAFSSYYPVGLLFNKEPYDDFQWWNGSQMGSQLAVDLLNKGKELTSLAISDNDLGNGYEEAITTYNELITRFENSHNTEIQEQVAEALLSKGEDLDHLHRYKEALTVYNKLITGFGDSQYTMAKALLNEGNDLEILHRIGQARADWKELVYRFKDNPYFIDQNAVAEARHNLSITKKEKTFFDRLSSLF
ncbi:MAG: tetratricopeptide repeat protein [Acetobacter sp.]|nr:tetratricopeptide repeat protein [Acetobacter sp.]